MFREGARIIVGYPIVDDMAQLEKFLEVTFFNHKGHALER